MSKILILTSGYYYKDWVGPYYPENTPSNDYLKLYQRDFKAVELNFSYYTQPKADMLKRMVSGTGEDFLFSIKAHQSLTHEIDDAGFQKNADVYKMGIEPLVSAGRLAAVLFQFPYSYHYTDDNRRYLDCIHKSLKDLPLAFEFRNAQWITDSLIQGLTERGIAFVNVDEPDLNNLIKPSAYVTSNLGYIRFHGRNKENWWSGNNTSRYDYLYSEDELKPWVGKIIEMVQKVKILLIAFNNHYKGQAVKNALQLKKLIQEAGFENVA
ncbi:MAG: DUF72 domain-containing protein [Spirochaetales bacterium]|nr:DUF72 domain-containing protein [Spirochaetales bacterium]